MIVKTFFEQIILIQRVWQGLSGVISIIFLTEYLDLYQQGWYYSFVSLSSLFTFLDLGLSLVIVQFSAHYFVGNEWGKKGVLIGKNTDQFLSLLNQSLHLYLKLGFIFCLLLVPAGIVFFELTSSNVSFNISWHSAWIVLAIATTLNIFLLPIFSAIEGSGSIKEVYSVRLVQGVIGSIAFCIVLASGGFLWAASVIPLSAFFVGISWLLMSRPVLLRDTFSHNGTHINWSSEVWPLQWRIGLSWLSGYLLTQIYTPILFYYQGAQVAGQMGLSLTLANMLGILAQSWIARRVPAMAQAVKQKNWQAFDQIFRRDFIVSVAFYVLGMLGFCFFYHFISDTRYSERVLSFWPFLGLLVVVLINHINGALAAQLRSYRKEPLVWVSLAGTILTVPIAVVCATYYSVNGVISSILFLQLLLIFPFSVHLWIKYNRVWRQ